MQILWNIGIFIDERRQSQANAEPRPGAVTECCSAHPEFPLCCLHSEFILSLYSQSCSSPWEACFPFPFPLLPTPLVPKAPHSALCPCEVSTPSPPHSLLMSTNWAKFSPFPAKCPNFKKEQGFSLPHVQTLLPALQDLAPSVSLSQLGIHPCSRAAGNYLIYAELLKSSGACLHWACFLQASRQ